MFLSTSKGYYLCSVNPMIISFTNKQYIAHDFSNCSINDIEKLQKYFQESYGCYLELIIN